jgi:hypothetical protein
MQPFRDENGRAGMKRAKRNESHESLQLRRPKPVTLDFWQESIVRVQPNRAPADWFETIGWNFEAGGCFSETERGAF